MAKMDFPRLLVCARRNTAIDQEGRRKMPLNCEKKNCEGVFRAQPIFKCFEDLERKLELMSKQKEEMNKPLQLSLEYA
jgi:hypothetical protein